MFLRRSRARFCNRPGATSIRDPVAVVPILALSDKPCWTSAISCCRHPGFMPMSISEWWCFASIALIFIWGYCKKQDLR